MSNSVLYASISALTVKMEISTISSNIFTIFNYTIKKLRRKGSDKNAG